MIEPNSAALWRYHLEQVQVVAHPENVLLFDFLRRYETFANLIVFTDQIEHVSSVQLNQGPLK